MTTVSATPTTSSLADLLRLEPLDIGAVAAWFDAASPDERLRGLRSLASRDQKRLFAAAEGRAGLSLDFMVPSRLGPLAEVIHEGWNNQLPPIRQFQKRFARHPTDAGALVGYNHQSFQWATGPGYFTARMSPDGLELLIDYTELPSVKVESWPRILPQTARLGFAVYAGMVDRLRPVSRHLSIGRAWRKGKPMGAYFALCRVDPA